MADRICIVCCSAFKEKISNLNCCSKDCLRDYNRKRSARWRKNNLEKVREKEAIWRKNNPDKLKAKEAKRYRENKEDSRNRNRKRYLENPEKIKEEKRKWARENPHRVVWNKVKYDLKASIGAEPPSDLVEEATALRLLNRTLREL